MFIYSSQTRRNEVVRWPVPTMFARRLMRSITAWASLQRWTPKPNRSPCCRPGPRCPDVYKSQVINIIDPSADGHTYVKSRSSIVGHAAQALSSCREPPTWRELAELPDGSCICCCSSLQLVLCLASRTLHRLQVNDRTPTFNGQPSLPCPIILLAVNTINVVPASFRCNLAAIITSHVLWVL